MTGLVCSIILFICDIIAIAVIALLVKNRSELKDKLFSYSMKCEQWEKENKALWDKINDQAKLIEKHKRNTKEIEKIYDSIKPVHSVTDYKLRLIQLTCWLNEEIKGRVNRVSIYQETKVELGIETYDEYNVEIQM